MNWAEFAAPAVAARAARLYSNMKLADRHRPLFNVTISNVPGPNFPLYSAGCADGGHVPDGARSPTAAASTSRSCPTWARCSSASSPAATPCPSVWDIAHGLDTALEDLRKAAEKHDG